MTTRMAEYPNVVALQFAEAVTSEMRANNRTIILNLLHSAYFLLRHWLPHVPPFSGSSSSSIVNSVEYLQQYINGTPAKAWYFF